MTIVQYKVAQSNGSRCSAVTIRGIRSKRIADKVSREASRIYCSTFGSGESVVSLCHTASARHAAPSETVHACTGHHRRLLAEELRALVPLPSTTHPAHADDFCSCSPHRRPSSFPTSPPRNLGTHGTSWVHAGVPMLVALCLFCAYLSPLRLEVRTSHIC